ncbi:MFS transporter [Nocardia sp. NRRL S-836]|uniref:MFS transporter n=1 Tax=Nocardia sp. NRRL S-836 TaxID=1519492 RepID=UPI0006ADCA9F|nr:MFS transporter [Nocardia sp. NRRL S-836]KOV84975.1 hypothetical protein ADL03_11410 [Nocardia sp. NRRL S-836]
MTDRYAGRLPLFGAMVIDALGNGLFAPFALVYAHKVVPMPLPTAGIVLTVAFGAATLAQPLVGTAVDRYGAIRVVIGGNALLFAGSVAMLGSTGPVPFGVAAFVFSLGGRAFWGAFTPLVGVVARPGELEQWFGRIRGLRYVGFAAGGALSGVVLSWDEVGGLRTLLGLNAVSFLLALLLFAAVKARDDRWAPAGRPAESGGYRTALTDSANVVLAGLNLVGNLVVITPLVALPTFVLQHLRVGSWLPGVLVAAGSAVVAVATSFNHLLTRGRRRLRTLQLSCATWVVAFTLVLLAVRYPAAAVALLLVAVALIGFGEALYVPTADTLPAVLAPAGHTGRYAAMHQLAWAVSDMLAPLLAATLLTASADALWLALGGASLVCLLLYRGLETSVGERDGISGAP